MSVTTIFSDKNLNSEKIKKSHGILLKYKPLWLIMLADSSITLQLIEWLKTLQAWFVVYSENMEEVKISNNVIITKKIDWLSLSWFDFIICDDEVEHMKKYLEKWVIPIIVRKNHMSSILKEFNPLRNEWNAFFYDELNVWSIFYSTVRYLENFKFPFDNKNLVNNILKI